MFRQLERSENIAVLIETGLRIALTRAVSAADEWESVVMTIGVRDAFVENHSRFDDTQVVNFMLRDKNNPSSVISSVEAARNNARLVRTAITREVWEATNECWMSLRRNLAKPVRWRDLPGILGSVRRQSAHVRGALHGTMLRNDIFDFARIGTFLERADSTARILNVKSHALLPSLMHVGAPTENVQWETILRSVSAEHAFNWLNHGETSASRIVDFLILDGRMPRSIAFCHDKILDNLRYLAEDYGERSPSLEMAEDFGASLKNLTTDAVFETGLHMFIQDYIRHSNALGRQIETDYRFQE